MKYIRIISLILCVVLCFSSCKKAPSEEGTSETTTVETESISQETESQVNIPQKENVTLPCNFSDGVNPYFMKSYENFLLCDLIYEPLFEVKENYDPIPQVAKEIIIVDKSVVVTLNSGHKCHGSNDINASDVVYSFNLAKQSYIYGGYLAGISSAKEVNSNSVEFTLDYGNINVAGKLNFPLVKQGTADSQTDVPTGSGRYYFSSGELVSSADNNKKIKLFPIGTSDSVADAFKIGDIDTYYSDLSDCDYSVTSGKVDELLLNNMVYLGFNSANGGLSKSVRSAIATAVNNEDIAKFSYEGHALGTKLPLSPKSKIYASLPEVNIQGDKERAVNILDRSGFIRYSGRAKTNGSYVLSFNLLVNNENKYRVAAAYSIADTLNEIGFLINVSAVPFAEYSEYINSGNFDMYLGEIKLDGAQDIGGFFRGETIYSAGINNETISAIKYFEYLSGQVKQEDYYEYFIEDYPFLPICFREGFTVSAYGVTPDVTLMPFGLYKNL